jgi:hypothetical protein
MLLPFHFSFFVLSLASLPLLPLLCGVTSHRHMMPPVCQECSPNPACCSSLFLPPLCSNPCSVPPQGLCTAGLTARMLTPAGAASPGLLTCQSSASRGPLCTPGQDPFTLRRPCVLAQGFLAYFMG